MPERVLRDALQQEQDELAKRRAAEWLALTWVIPHWAIEADQWRRKP